MPAEQQKAVTATVFDLQMDPAPRPARAARARKGGDPNAAVGQEPLPTRTTSQIGRCGELLVQYRLLKYGIESAAMTTDRGIDLVAFVASRNRALTIQVKTNLRPKPGGGRGALALDWWVSEVSPADLVALVDLDTESVWLF